MPPSPQRFDTITDTIGNTPCVRINRLAPEGVEIYVKAEFFNPGASVKDRLALSIIETAEKNGSLKPGQTVIEATSGNTGIGLAMVCAAKGYPFVCTMVETFSVERRQLMKYLGAKVILTPKEKKGFGMVEHAQKLAKKNGWFLASQFETDANADMHERTTGPEIVEAFGDIGLDYWVTGFGTGGTVTGVARVLRDKMPDTKIVLSEPEPAQMVASGHPQPRNDDGTPTGSHEDWTPHPIQGWSPDFIPLVLQEAIDNKYYDELIPVTGEDGMKWARELAAKEGILTGISGGSTFAVAMRLAERADKGTRILCMLPDTAERYLSTPLFAPFGADMSEEETALSAPLP